MTAPFVKLISNKDSVTGLCKDFKRKVDTLNAPSTSVNQEDDMGRAPMSKLAQPRKELAKR